MIFMHTFKTYCVACNQEVEIEVMNFKGKVETRLEELEDLEFNCKCGAKTGVNVDFYDSEY